MAKQTINVGTNQDDGTGDSLRGAFQKVNSNFAELYNEIGGDSLSNIKFIGSTITTDDTNTNLILDPNGTGKIELGGDTLARGEVVAIGQLRGATLQVDTNANIDGNLTVDGTFNVGTLSGASLSTTGTLTVQGNADLQGNIDLGDSSADTITAVGRFDSSLVPSVTLTDDLGSSSLRWRDGYLRDVSARTFTATAATSSVIPFYYDNQAAFPSATTYHGAIAHSHADGAMYFAHGGSWVKLANDAAYLTSESDTLETVTNRGASTINTVTVGSIVVDKITINDSSITTTGSNEDLQLDPNGTGRVEVVADRILIKEKYTPSSSQGAAGDRQGDVAFDDDYVYYCKQNYDGATNIWTRAAMATW